jgi:hypothetical protein
MEFVKKHITKIILGILCVFNLSLCSNLNHTQKNVSKQTAEIKSLQNKIDTLNHNFQVRLAIENYRSTMNTVYDNNAIVRTVKRPDDRMKHYSNKIDSLRGKLWK